MSIISWLSTTLKSPRGSLKVDSICELRSLFLFSHSVMSNSLWSYGLQHTKLPCPSPSPRVCSNSCPLSRCHPTISSSPRLLFYLQPFPASGSFPVNIHFGRDTNIRSIAVSLWHIIFQCYQHPSTPPSSAHTNQVGQGRGCAGRMTLMSTPDILAAPLNITRALALFQFSLAPEEDGSKSINHLPAGSQRDHVPCAC